MPGRNPRQWSFRGPIAILAAALAVSLTMPTQAQMGRIPANDRVDMVYDHFRDVLYITNGDHILRYQLGTGQFLAPLSPQVPGTKLMGIDISPDYKWLLVADQSATIQQSQAYLVDLDTDVITPLVIENGDRETGTYSVAFAADGSGFVTMNFRGSGWSRIREYDPATKTLSPVPPERGEPFDAGRKSHGIELRQASMLTANAYRNVIAYCESNSSDGPYGYYDVASRTFHLNSPGQKGAGGFCYEIGINPAGNQFAIPLYTGMKVVGSNRLTLLKLGEYAGSQPIGIVYHPVANLAFCPWTKTTNIIAHDTSTADFKAVGSFNVGDQFKHNGNAAYVQGRMRISADGSALFCTVTGGVAWVRLYSPLTAHDQTVATAEGAPVEVVLKGTVGEQEAPGYRVAQQPAHGTLTGEAPELTYAPEDGFKGKDSFTFQAQYGPAWSRPATVTVCVGVEPEGAQPAAAG